MFKPTAKGVMYIGQDPTGKGFIKIAIESMSEEQVAAWLLIDPATASKFFYPHLVRPYTPPAYDNNPGTPLPKLKKYEQHSTTKASAKEE
jgi:hypothetical protein